MDGGLAARNLVPVRATAMNQLSTMRMFAKVAESLIEKELQEGTLQPLLQAFELENNERTVWMLYSGHRYMTQRVRGFVDFVANRYRHPTWAPTAFDMIPAAHFGRVVDAGIETS
jgi:DNA-binding transcriptional LysR family regulator